MPTLIANPTMKKSKMAVKKCRVVVMGASGTGKTSLVSQFLGQGFPEHHEETVEEMYHSEVQTTSMIYHLEILDTTGSYSFPAMRRLAISKADVFVLVFSMDLPQSLERIKTLRGEILALKGENVNSKIIIVANKADVSSLMPELLKDQISASVTLEWECQFVETSAKTRDGVNELFDRVISLQQRDNSSPALTPSSSSDVCIRQC